MERIPLFPLALYIEERNSKQGCPCLYALDIFSDGQLHIQSGPYSAGWSGLGLDTKGYSGLLLP